MRQSIAVVLCATGLLAAAYTVDPPTTAPSDTIQDCTSWDVVSSSDTCQSIADFGFITLDQLYAYNPSLAASGCPIIVGDSYCVEQNFGVPPPPSSTSKAASTTTTGNGVTTPTPTQTGMVSNCNKFHKVVSGDSCAVLASANGISLDTFYSWNPAVGTSCASLILDYYVCVGVISQGGSTTTKPGNGVSTPGPVQTGIVSNCNSFHLVVSGDTCPDIASKAGISLDNFYAWNPAVKSDCTQLLAGDYVCIGIIGGTTVKPTSTSTKPGNGISTPGPIQTGMIGSCNKFHLVVSGDTCPDLATSNAITLANFYAWNPAVKSDCTSLIVGDYVCVGIVGGTTVKPTSTSTKPGNGISTPGPIQTGMIGSCNKFHLVVSGDSCPALASSNGITLANFYSWNPAVKSDCTSLIVGDYVCVGIVGGTTIKPTSTTTKPGNGITTPTPTQTGMVSNCNSFYLVKSGDSCATVAAAKGISLDNFYKWNPAVGTGCSSLLVSYYVCVNIVGGPTPTTMKTSKTTPGNGVATPTPTQAGMVTNCKTFHLVVSGDSCQAIATNAKITLANFEKWNPGVGSTCSSLWLGYYVCIGLI
ncbi:hypothetical protein N5P37_010131 [Trichoderma harzianum]|uniref:Carbohydrate-binding module family 50 protein n=1 Tax=Trichoderma harzianum CBS 226.95 TaxID=983964 RepID=A0A2T4A522_TRIHA|nr:carbohydrate-binding module family 50 protein [Trichoderma harzianum CBS 226.95]KAK0757408.1 hypothetical protein N5P37_010131 [Trichoderma harzianum]PTB52165.1 carbohydrate-binding module family 50 protein [Trichoderma harzianum CBS 226.95]